MSDERLYTAVSKMQNICDSINMECTENIEYVVLQGVSEEDRFAKDPFIAYRITEFYNNNWTGNVDFMHIPNFNQVLENCNSYPIIIAREKDSKKILGISTIKYDENIDSIDPYYPEEDEKFFTITGILTRKNNKYKGIGKKIYEIAMRGYHEFNKIYDDTKLICVVDCRNKNSINALYCATESANKKANKKDRLHSRIISYYLVKDKNNDMVEAPTIVIETSNSRCKHIGNRPVVEFERDEREQFRSLLTTLRDSLTIDRTKPIVNEDEAGTVAYYRVNNNQVLPRVIPNGTEDGNDRIPRKRETTQAMFRLRLIR